MQYDKDNFDFNELVIEISDEMQRSTQTHKIELSLTDTKTIIGDKNRIGQVIINLIANAIKYSPDANRIVITTSNSNDNIKCCVQDFGIGIPLDQQSKIFTRFFRVSEVKNNTYPGLGLGLYITNEIIQRHSGNIDFKSEEDKGSTFCFSLPLKN